ncbi:hypothetical protein B0H34DRAFT_676372 [Crassisporium funariophilum]|nr:hypothetical protein B0H34DRAFT_676372 [Crassisporium funariophilum]
MDIDPLSDTVPPRYAIESDEEEDEINPLRVNTIAEDTTLDIVVVGDFPKRCRLIVVSGDAGSYWAKGVPMGLGLGHGDEDEGEGEDADGVVSVNGVEVGCCQRKPWTNSIVMILEGYTGLPLFAMHPFAERVIDALQPSRGSLSISILDSYPVPSYATDQAVPFHEAPLRYLTTFENTDFLDSNAKLFAPPNLIQTVSSSFLTIASTRPMDGTLILLPSPHIPRPAPKHIAPNNISRPARDAAKWPADLMDAAQTLLFGAVNEKITRTWELLPQHRSQNPVKRRTEIGDGGMYI